MTIGYRRDRAAQRHPYSWRSAAFGSMLMARNAGTKVATTTIGNEQQRSPL